MKLTLGQIVSINQEIDTLLTKDLKASLAYKISKFKLRLHELANIANQKRDALIMKLGEDEGDNKVIKPSNPNWDEYLKEVTELYSTEEELDDFSISAATLDNIELSPKFFINMGELITD